MKKLRIGGVVCLLLGIGMAAANAAPIEPTWDSMAKNYDVPDWFLDGKFGKGRHLNGIVPEEDGASENRLVHGLRQHTVCLRGQGQMQAILPGPRSIDIHIELTSRRCGWLANRV